MTHLKPEQLNIYPVKSCGGISVDKLFVDQTVGVVGDRLMGFTTKPPPEGGDGAYRSKHFFLNGMRYPEMVLMQPEVDFSTEKPTVTKFQLQGKPVSLEQAPKAVQELLKLEEAPRLVQAFPDQHFTDRHIPFVSIINLDTLDAFASYVGDKNIALPARWRGNVYVRAGLGTEYTWSRRQSILTIGDRPFQVLSLLARCAMITASPLTGQRDHTKLIRQLYDFEVENRFSHPEEMGCMMGVLAIPLQEGLIER